MKIIANINWFCTAICLMALLVPNSVNAQEEERDCAKFYKSVLFSFEAGRYDEVIQQVGDGKNIVTCDSKQREELNEILASAYLEVDNMEQGLSYIKKILKHNPYFKAGDSKYSLEPFLSNLNRFTVKPLLSFGIRAGYDVPIFLTSKRYYILAPALISNKNAWPKPKPSYHAGIMLKYNITKNIYACFEGNFQELNYERSIEALGSNNTTDNGFRNSIIKYRENVRSINIPLYVGYALHMKKDRFVPSAYIGASYSYTFQATSALDAKMQRFVGQDLTNVSNENFLYVDNSLQNIKTIDQRNQHNLQALVGLRATYQNRFIGLFFDVRYYYNYRMYEKANTRYDNQTLIDYYYVDNSSRLTNAELSVGFTYNIYHPIKQKY